MGNVNWDEFRNQAALAILVKMIRTEEFGDPKISPKQAAQMPHYAATMANVLVLELKQKVEVRRVDELPHENYSGHDDEYLANTEEAKRREDEHRKNTW